jgi:chromosome partitioning protein
LARVIAIANQKGGVGKTTTTINLGAYLARSGQKVLIVDMDPQGNTSSGLGLDRRGVKQSMYEVMVDGLPMESILFSCEVEGLYLAPALPSLAGAEVELVNASEREYRLRKSLGPLRGYYDFILLDCPPSLSLITVNALVAATEVLIPVQAEYYALEGLGHLTSTISKIRSKLNPNLKLAGLLLTMNDKRTVLSREIQDEIHKHFPGQVFKSVIPRNVKLAESPSYGKSILEYDNFSKGARSYKALAKEVLNGTEAR